MALSAPKGSYNVICMPIAVDTTHVLMDRTLIVYRRERSAVWQCRYQVNRKWQRESTGEHELPKAIEKAKKIYITASKSLKTQRWVAILPRQTTVGPGRDIGAHNAIERQWCYEDKGFGAD
jgi:hypothetical protein